MSLNEYITTLENKNKELQKDIFSLRLLNEKLIKMIGTEMRRSMVEVNQIDEKDIFQDEDRDEHDYCCCNPSLNGFIENKHPTCHQDQVEPPS
jgi:hypothetical protein